MMSQQGKREQSHAQAVSHFERLARRRVMRRKFRAICRLAGRLRMIRARQAEVAERGWGAAAHYAAPAWGWGGGGAMRCAALSGGWSAGQQKRQERKVSPRLPVRARNTPNPLSAFSSIAADSARLHGGGQVCGAMERTLKRIRAPGDIGDAARPPRPPRLQPTFNEALNLPAFADFALDTSEVTRHDLNPAASLPEPLAAAKTAVSLTSRVPAPRSSLRPAECSARPNTSSRSQGALICDIG